MELEPKVGEIWFSEYNWRYIYITYVERLLVHFYFIDDPDEPNSRNKRIFHGIFKKYKGLDDEIYV